VHPQAEDWGQWLLLLVDSDEGPDGQVVAVPLSASLVDAEVGGWVNYLDLVEQVTSGLSSQVE
jgi:hypothetical protein